MDSSLLITAPAVVLVSQLQSVLCQFRPPIPDEEMETRQLFAAGFNPQTLQLIM